VKLSDSNIVYFTFLLNSSKQIEKHQRYSPIHNIHYCSWTSRQETTHTYISFIFFYCLHGVR